MVLINHDGLDVPNVERTAEIEAGNDADSESDSDIEVNLNCEDELPEL
jgi:hypothetical protein